MRLRRCGNYSAYLKNTNSKTGVTRYKYIDFGCGRSDCPECRRRKQTKLIRRLNQAKWSKHTCFWTITTDPKILAPDEAIRTLNRRWHNVHRELMRMAPGLRYFRVTELTKSGLPHIHLITDSYLAWHTFRDLLVNHDFGHVLHYKRIPAPVAIRYLCKYIAKELYLPKSGDPIPGRRWMATRGLLPTTTYHSANETWDVVFVWNRSRPMSDQAARADIQQIQKRPPPEPVSGGAIPLQRELAIDDRPSAISA